MLNKFRLLLLILLALNVLFVGHLLQGDRANTQALWVDSDEALVMGEFYACYMTAKYILPTSPEVVAEWCMRNVVYEMERGRHAQNMLNEIDDDVAQVSIVRLWYWQDDLSRVPEEFSWLKENQKIAP